MSLRCLSFDRENARVQADPFYPETGLDDFGARYNSSTLGRFLTPDWSAQAEPVPYAKLDHPQSLNLYTYVLNNPVSRVDPDGHVDWGMLSEGVLDVAAASLDAAGAAGSAALAPETGGVSLAGTAYLSLRAAGNISSGFSEVLGGLTDNTKAGEKGAQAATAATTISGIVTLVKTKGNIEEAGAAGNVEAALTLSARGAKGLIKEVAESRSATGKLIKATSDVKTLNDGVRAAPAATRVQHERQCEDNKPCK